MEPKEKAYELWEQYYCLTDYGSHILDTDYAKKYAIIAVNELIYCVPSVDGRLPNYQTVDKYCKEYWEDVKKEIELI